MTHRATTYISGGRKRNPAPHLLAALVTFALALLAMSGSASAVVIRSQIEAFGPDGTAASSFIAPRDLAFNQVTRNLYGVESSEAATWGIYGFDASTPPTHPPLGGFSPLDTVPPGGDPGIAVDDTGLPSAGNIYFVSESTGLIYGFDSLGTPLGGNFPIDPAVNPGAPLGSPKDICGAAVDTAGNVWVPNFSTRRILEYSSSGVYKDSVSTASQGFFPCSVAFDSNDDMYVTNGGDGSGVTYKYTAASAYTSATLLSAAENTNRSNAVDRVTHHVFVVQRAATVGEYDASGNQISTTSEKDSSGDMIIPTSNGIKDADFRGIAVDSADNHLYVSDGSVGKIRVFGDPLTYPDLTLDGASGIETTSAIVSGTVSAQGIALNDCHFEYIDLYEAESFDDLSSGGSVPCGPAAGSIPVDSAAHSVSASLTGLHPNTPYRFRLVASNANGAIATPASAVFETIGPPIVETTGSPVRTTTTARLDGRVDPAGVPATFHFEYGTQGPCDSNPCTSTPDNKLGPDEVQKITIKASAGQFKLGYGADTTSELPFNASALEVQSALEALPSIGAGNVTVTGGPGEPMGSRPYFVAFGSELASTDVQQITVQSGSGKKALSSPHSAKVETTQSGGNGFNEAQSITVAASGGQFKLGFGADASSDIAFNATAATVADALEAMSTIGAGNVVVSGGPGDVTGANPYVVRFVGKFANTDVAQMTATNGTTPLSGTTEFGAETTVPGGISEEFLLVSARLGGLQPNTTYHYRVVAENGNPAGPQFGEDKTVTTFADEVPLSHGRFPGPVGSDRAWELVSAPDTSGNPVGVTFAPGAAAISDNGNRAVYAVAGGTPLSEAGSASTRLFAERTPSGWETKQIFAPRIEATGSSWTDPQGPGDLSTMVAENAGVSGEFSVWHLFPSGPPTKLFGGKVGIRGGGETTGMLLTAESGTREIISLIGTQDPAYPIEGENSTNLYDVSSGQPKIIDLLPDGTVPSCGIPQDTNGGSGMPSNPDRSAHWVTADGTFAFFEEWCSDGLQRLYARNLQTETTTLVSPPPLSGPRCAAHFIKSTPGFAYFYTQSRLVAKDVEPLSCGGASASGGDIYRYALSNGELDCVTCLKPGVETDVTYSGNADELNRSIGIAEDGSRIYFTSGKRLIAGGAGREGLYRLDVSNGNLAYVGSFGFIGDYDESEIAPDGSVVVFKSKDPSLNVPNGQQNGGTTQIYRYDDRDRSLICVSCPGDGSLPRGPVTGRGLKRATGAANASSLSANGEDLVFATPTPLVTADQNTAGVGQDGADGVDIYEWRAGKVLLVSDGLSNWPTGEAPEVSGITPSGHDIFFTEAAELTPDALDGYKRLYDARIGGGFEFPRPPQPCPLEVCQGTPKGAPEEQAPGTQYLQGAQNIAPTEARCAKAKVRRKGRCVARHKHIRKPAQHNRAKHDRRAHR